MSSEINTFKSKVNNVLPSIQKDIRLKNVKYLESNADKVKSLFDKYHQNKMDTLDFLYLMKDIRSDNNLLRDRNLLFIIQNKEKELADLYKSIDSIINKLTIGINKKVFKYFYNKVLNNICNTFMISPILMDRFDIRINPYSSISSSFSPSIDKCEITVQNIGDLIHVLCKTLVSPPTFSTIKSNSISEYVVYNKLKEFLSYPRLPPDKIKEKLGYLSYGIDEYLKNHLSSHIFEGFANEMENKILNTVLQEIKKDFENKKNKNTFTKIKAKLIDEKNFTKIKDMIELLKFNNALRMSFLDDKTTFLGIHYYQSLRKAVSRLLPIGTLGNRDKNAFDLYYRYLDLPADEQMEIMAKLIDDNTFKEGIEELKQKIVENIPAKRYPRPGEYFSK